MIVTNTDFDRGIAFEFLFTQGTPAVEWVINHNMDCHPSVSVIDSSNNQVEGSVFYNSLNRVTLTFTAPFSGRAILR